MLRKEQDVAGTGMKFDLSLSRRSRAGPKYDFGSHLSCSERNRMSLGPGMKYDLSLFDRGSGRSTKKLLASVASTIYGASEKGPLP
jgi:hypothetical protein